MPNCAHTQIDDQLDWFDLQSNETVSAEEIKSKISIPPTLKPNLKQIPFVFFTKEHRLVFVSRDSKVTLSPRQAEIFFDRLFSAPEIQREFKNTEVTIEQSKEALDRIFDELRLTKLQILVNVQIPTGRSRRKRS